jgi:microcystin-dependent protein
MSVFSWSRTPATNATADSGINLRDNQAPSVVKLNNRQMMAELAEWRDDLSGATATAGTSSAFTLTTYQGFTSLTDGLVVAFVPHATNAVGATLAVDGLTAKPLRARTGVSIPAGVIVLGTPYTAVYNISADEWRLHGIFDPAGLIPLGSGIEYWGPTAPSSNFAIPYAQAISRTTYAPLFAIFGTTFGAGDGSTTFNLPDVAGRLRIVKDNISGSPAGRVTTAGSGIDGTTLGATGGAQTVTLARANLPNVTLAGETTGTDAYSISVLTRNYVISGSGNTDANRLSRANENGNGATDSISGPTHNHDILTESINGGVTQTAVNKMPPGIVCNYIIRIL